MSQPYPAQPQAGSQSYPLQQPYSGPAPQSGPGWGAPQPPAPPHGQPPMNPYGAQPQPGQPGPYGGAPGPYGAPNAPMGQPQYGAPNPVEQYQPQPGPQGIVVDAAFFPMNFMLALTGPRITVNGMEVPGTKWGQTHIPVGPGQHHVRVAAKWIWDLGAAEAAVPVAEGYCTPVYYKTPAIAWVRGALGPVSGPFPGATWAYVSYGIIGVLFVLRILLTIAAMG
ncbi:MAG: hypothetical protein J2P18_18885 [Nocardia sp.]|nr:hypothetical protein [Nocardia sp.]